MSHLTDPRPFLKNPILFEEKFWIYTPSVQEVVTLDTKFGQYLKVLTISQEELEDEYKDKLDENGNEVVSPTPLEFIIVNSHFDPKFEEITKEAFYFFLRKEISFLSEMKSILIGNIEDYSKPEDIVLLNEENYFNFQNKIRSALGQSEIEPPREDEDPRVKRIKAKARLRDRIKAQKGGGISLLTSMASLCCMGMGINPLNVGEISYACMDLLIRTNQEKEKYETDIASLIAGADSKKVKPKYWIRNLD